MSVTEHEDGNLKCVSDCIKHWLNKLKNPPSASLTTTTLVDKTVWQHELNCGGSPRCRLIGPSTALVINSICLWFVVLSQFFIHSINVHFRRLSGGGCCVILPIFHQFIKKKIYNLLILDFYYSSRLDMRLVLMRAARMSTPRQTINFI